MTEWVNMKWLMEQTGIKSHAAIKKRILEPHREELCKFVRYPEKQGQPWQFSRVHMVNWLRNKSYRRNNVQTSTVLSLLISVGLAMYLLGKEITEEKMNSKIRVLHRKIHELERSR